MSQPSRRENSFLGLLKALKSLGIWFFMFESGAVFSEAWPTSSLLTLNWAGLVDPKSYILCTEISKSLPLSHEEVFVFNFYFASLALISL